MEEYYGGGRERKASKLEMAEPKNCQLSQPASLIQLLHNKLQASKKRVSFGFSECIADLAVPFSSKISLLQPYFQRSADQNNAATDNLWPRGVMGRRKE